MNTTIDEIILKTDKIKAALQAASIDSLLLGSVPNFLYLTGSVAQGYIFIHKDEALPLLFLERPTYVLEGYPEELIFNVRKPELIPDLLKGRGSLYLPPQP